MTYLVNMSFLERDVKGHLCCVTDTIAYTHSMPLAGGCRQVNLAAVAEAPATTEAEFNSYLASLPDPCLWQVCCNP